MSEWTSVILGSYVEHTKGFAFKSKDYQESGVPIIKVKNFTTDSIKLTDCDFLDSNKLEKYQKVLLKKGDVLIATVGSWLTNPNSVVGKTIRVPQIAENTLLNQNAVRLKAVGELNQNFLYYLLKHDNFKYYIVGTAQGSANQASITLIDIFNYSFNLPPLPEQKVIAHILGTLDEKIEINRQMNQTLEALAQALFKSWFVDFDPVLDNALTAGNEIPEELQGRAEKRKEHSDSKKLLSTNPSLAAQFPDSFVFNETLGKWIPEGWDFQAIGDHLYIKGRIGWKGLKRSEYSSEETGYRIVNGSDFQDEQINSKSCGWISKDRYDESPEIQLQENDILITKDGTIGKLAFVYNLNEKSSVASGVFVVRVISDQMSTMFCWSFFKSTLFQNVVKTKIDGSVIPHLYQRDFVEMYIPVPGKEILDQFENQSEAIFTKIFKNKLEIETLTQLRDRLLPELISGRVRAKH